MKITDPGLFIEFVTYLLVADAMQFICCDRWQCLILLDNCLSQIQNFFY